MPDFNHKGQQFSDYRITLLGNQETRSRMTKRLEKVFERRRAADSTSDDGTRTVVMRDQTVVVFKPKKANGASSFREPFLEMSVRTTEEYRSRSVKAMRDYAMSQNLVLYVDVVAAKPEEDGSRSSGRQAVSERPRE